MPESRETRIHFHSDGVEDGVLVVAGLDASEGISQIYRFEIDLISEDPEVDLDGLLAQPARLEIEREGEEPRVVHGVLAAFEQGDSGPVFTAYRAVLVPKLWHLSHSSANEVHQNRTAEEILTAELKAGGFGASDYEFWLDGPRSKQKYEHVLQFDQTNLDFLHQRAEREGFFYFFDQPAEGPGEKLIVCDRSGRVPMIEGAVPYRPPSGLDEPEEESLFSWRCRVAPVPETVTLCEYNWRTPRVDLKAEVPVPGGDRGRICQYGEHYKTPSEGRELAMIRAEEQKCRRVRFFGQSHCIRLTAGHRFELVDHPRPDFNGEYLIVSVRHRVVQSTPGDAVRDLASAPGLAYRNEIEAIPAAVSYRPPRITPRPRLHGVMNAVVEGETSSPYAEIDDMGRYRVRFSFDIGDAEAGKASRYLRMSLPYAGESEGATFPLRKGTEVLWACIDGDPDRPVILGAVPNPSNPNRVTDQNRSKSIVQTASGVLIEMNDSIPG